MSECDVESGRRKLDWARSHMPIHAELRRLYADSRPFAGVTVAVGSHIEAKTGVFLETLVTAGARVVFTASVAATTQNDVVAALNEQAGIEGFARREADAHECEAHHDRVLEHEPNLILDDAAELTARMVYRHPTRLKALLGVCEQTATGVQRLRALANEGRLAFPAYAVNDTPMKHYFDNVHGTGESSLANLAVVTNLLVAGKRIVVAGFGYCGRGVAHKARGWGARVTVTEIDPRKALRAHMEGFEVAPMAEAVQAADLIVTTTGNRDVLRQEHFQHMQDGVVLANAGHFCVEIALAALADYAASVREVRPGITEYRLPDGRNINVVAGAELVNLAAPTAMGHPVEVMDQTFAMQFMAALHLLENRAALAPGLHPVPDEVDCQVAQLKLATLGIRIDSLTDDQRRYLGIWRRSEILP